MLEFTKKFNGHLTHMIFVFLTSLIILTDITALGIFSVKQLLLIFFFN